MTVKKFQIVGYNFQIKTFLISLGYVEAPEETGERPDFVVIPGGADVSPNLYFKKKEVGTNVDQQDDYNEIMGIIGARILGIPQIGICKGFQLLHVSSGGTLVQHIEGHAGRPHKVYIKPGQPSMEVTSTHHQAVPREETSMYEEVFFSEDGITESIITPSRNWGGVQWHPEYIGASKECKEFFHNIIKKLTEKAAA